MNRSGKPEEIIKRRNFFRSQPYLKRAWLQEKLLPFSQFSVLPERFIYLLHNDPATRMDS